jgi:RND family efflux transporter MFP subunit
VRAALEEFRAREEFAKRELARVTELIGRGVASTQAHERAAMDLRQIQALISVQMERIKDYVITAPIDGVVLRRDGEVGEIAEVGQILFRVGVLRPLQVVAEVNEEDIPRVVLGQLALLRTDAFPGQRLEGKVRELTPMGDSVAKTYRIRIALPDDTPLKPGMSVEANVVTREKPNALLVPADAVQGTAVYVVEGDRMRRKNVEIGIRGTRAVEILSGLRTDERVVSPLAPDAQDGRRIRIVDRISP